MSSLLSFSLAHNILGDDGVATLAPQLTSLCSLDISQNNIKKDGVEAIGKMSSLLSLNISSNDDLRWEEIVELKQNLPGCRVKFMHKGAYYYSADWDHPVLDF